jgi:SAM-dependent methyltransferase
MTEGTAASRNFSNRKHASGAWRTRTVFLVNPVARAVASFLSYKRAGVDRLARELRLDHRLVVDLGAGQGAYAHWFLGRRVATVITIDWSAEALRRMPVPRCGKVLRLCADAQKLPLKPGTADALFTIDMLGHTENIEQALDEILRVVKNGAPVFLHSECGSYKDRWPDAMLIRRIGYDFPARSDGHQSLLAYKELRAHVSRRFYAEKVWSPAGITGWLTGYPEKYRPAFKEAGCTALQTLTALFALIKKTPGAGLALRFVNSSINHIETALGMTGGGGSFFARLRKPDQPYGSESRKGLV